MDLLLACREGGNGRGGGLGSQVCFVLAMLFAPAVLMGGTLPVLTRLVTRTLGELQERVSTLYFVNSAGAVAGVILAEFWWIPTGGLSMTVYAAAMNLLAGAGALGMSGYWGEEGNKAPIREASAASRSPERRLILWAISLSGFAVMLLTFISGIADGSWLAEDGWSDVVAAVCLSGDFGGDGRFPFVVSF